MPLLEFLLIITCAGVILYCVNRFVPMDPTVKRIMNWVVLGCLVLWVLNLFGVFGPLQSIRVGR